MNINEQLVKQWTKKQERTWDLNHENASFHAGQLLSYGMEDKHAIEQVYLFNSKHPNESRRVQAHQISYMDSSQFREIIFRCFQFKV